MLDSHEEAAVEAKLQEALASKEALTAELEDLKQVTVHTKILVICCSELQCHAHNYRFLKTVKVTFHFMAPPSSRHLMSHLIQLSPWGAEGISSCRCRVSSGAREKSIRSHGSRGSSAAGAGYFGGASLLWRFGWERMGKRLCDGLWYSAHLFFLWVQMAGTCFHEFPFETDSQWEEK